MALDPMVYTLAGLCWAVAAGYGTLWLLGFFRRPRRQPHETAAE